MTRFAPVHLPQDRALNGRVSQTFLKHYSLCPRSAWLYAKYKGEAATREMQRGKAVHLVRERMIRTCIEEGEFTVPGEVVKAITDEVLAEIHVPFEEHDLIRECAWRMAEEFAVDPSKVVAVETLFVLDVGGFEVRCRIDFAELLDGGTVLHVEDTKSSRAAVPYEQISRKSPDGRLVASNFQLVLYALAMVYGVPAREEDCCVPGPYDVGTICPDCGGPRRLTIRVDAPYMGQRIQRADLEFVYPAIEDREGKMVRRRVSLTRAEIEEYRASLDGLLTRLRESEHTGDWPAVASDAACSICPAKPECPIPVEVNDHRGEINTPEDCADALEVSDVQARIQRALSSEIRNFVKANGPVRYGGGMVAEIGQRSSEEIRDKAGMFDAIERGEFDRAEWVRVKESFPLVKRAVTEEDDG